MQIALDGIRRLVAVSRPDSTRAVPRFARILLWMMVIGGATCLAQPPGTYPPPESVKEAASGGATEDLPINGFMFLDVSGNPVMMPTMSYERLMELISGSDTAKRPFAIKSLKIDGSVDRSRAELTVQVQLQIDSTGGQLTPIPLQMGNFHLLQSPEFSSSPPGVPQRDVERMTIGPDGTGYVLWVQSDRPRETVVKMNVSARVDRASRDSLYFRLPNAPAKINIAVPMKDADGEINGRGDEVRVPVAIPGGTEFRIESGGGPFQLNWGQQPPSPASDARFEVDSTVNATWNAPDDRMSMSVTWRIRSLRGQVGVFDVQLPPGASLEGKPVLVSSGLPVNVDDRDESGRIRISIPSDERGETKDLSLKVSLDPVANGQWMKFQIPRIIGGVRQQGDVVIRTVGDYRLRWQSDRGIGRTLDGTSDDAPNTRAYSFQFDRAAFSMPIMLSAQAQVLRLACQSDITFGNASAELEMTIQTTGEASDSRQIEIDFADWGQRSVVDAETGEILVIGNLGSKTQVSLTQDDGSQASLIRINAVRGIDRNDKLVEFKLPQINTPDSLLIESNDVTVRSTGRLVLNVDFDASESIESSIGATESSSAMVSQFRVEPPNAFAVVRGPLVSQQPQITLESNAAIMLEASQLVTTVNWQLTSEISLNGRLDIAIAQLSSASPLSELAEAAGLSRYLNDSGNPSVASGNWTVTVNGREATLRPTARKYQYELVSDLLGEGTFTIKWRYAHDIVGDAAQEVALPRLINADVELLGDVRVTLSGNQETDLRAADASDRTSLQFAELPREPVRIRLVQRGGTERELSVRRAVLRTAVGRNTRHEQVLAIAQGGDAFRVGLNVDGENLKTECYVDGKEKDVRRENNTLSVPLPSDQDPHIVDMRVWVDEPTVGLLPTIKPVLRLPVGVGRVFWQVVLPEDSHVVWVSPTIGQAMTWQLSGWRLARTPVMTDKSLCERIGPVTASPMPPGNPYLYVGSDILSFQAMIASRATIWLFVGGIVLICATVFAYVPAVRTPLTAIFAAFVFAGLLAIAPDAAVLMGQFAMVAMVLVIIMYAIRAMLAPRRSRLMPRRPQLSTADGSTKTAEELPVTPGSSIRSTATAASEPSGVST